MEPWCKKKTGIKTGCKKDSTSCTELSSQSPGSETKMYKVCTHIVTCYSMFAPYKDEKLLSDEGPYPLNIKTSSTSIAATPIVYIEHGSIALLSGLSDL